VIIVGTGILLTRGVVVTLIDASSGQGYGQANWPEGID